MRRVKLSDVMNARSALLGFLFLPRALARASSPSLGSLLATGAMLGAAGASFAVALPLASRWFPLAATAALGLRMLIAGGGRWRARGDAALVLTGLAAPAGAGGEGAQP